MRRKEFAEFNQDEYLEIMTKEHVGQLGVVDKMNYPRIVPVNFVLYNDNIYFHGALEGEKYALLKENPKVTFSVYEPYSYIPSYFQSTIACQATIFFKSVHIRGQGSLVEDFNEKIKVVIKLMEKHQPEKKYDEIELSNPKYYHYMETTGIFKITPTEVTVKQKFGQNLNDSVISHIIEYLTERNTPIDVETIIEIKKRRPVTS